MAAATMADATADTLAMDTVLSSPDLLTVIAHATSECREWEVPMSAQCVCKRFSVAFGSDAVWKNMVYRMLRTKPSRYIDTLNYISEPTEFAHLSGTIADRNPGPFTRVVKECLESGRAKTWLSIFKAVMIDGQRSRIDESEIQSMTFDFRFRASPDHCASSVFRFDSTPAYTLFDDFDYQDVSDDRRAEAARLMALHGRYSEEPEAHVKLVVNHPNGLNYEWAVENNGARVKLGPYPRAWVRRLPDWRWVIANPNVVLIECDMLTTDRFPNHAELLAADLATEIWGQEGSAAWLAILNLMGGLNTEDSDGSDVDDRWPEGTHPGDDYYDGDLFPYHENGSSSSDEYEDDSGSQSDEED